MAVLSKLLWLSYGCSIILMPILVFTSIYIPNFLPNEIILLLIVVLCILLGVLSPILLQLKLFKIIAWITFIIASIAVIQWFFISEFTYILFFTICNLCFMFMYSLFFTSMPFYAIKYQPKFEQSSVKGYHIHENTYGILLILLGFGCLYMAFEWRINIGAIDFLKSHLLLFFGVFTIILGGFLIGRDYRDLKQLNFIEKNNTRKLDPAFNKRDLFYRTSPFGLVISLIGVNFLLQSWFWDDLFSPDRTFFKIIGIVLAILGAIVSGLNPTYFAKKANVL